MRRYFPRAARAHKSRVSEPEPEPDVLTDSDSKDDDEEYSDDSVESLQLATEDEILACQWEDNSKTAKEQYVPGDVKDHIKTMPPEILRGTYTIMPSSRPKRGLDQNRPPISTIEEIFDDLVSKAEKNGFSDFLKHIGNRELRVATMCSGTEAPLLALEMISESFKRLFGQSFRMHHLFSAEIEPFKQSYIQRNFSPNILFRDVSELVQDEATTAFGSVRRVPTDPDLLVAGFSCVDFSQLNSHRKSLEEMGESGHTFFPILQYVKRCRPPLVILENVFGAPWSKIAEIYQKNGYHAYHASIDTKNFYLPQTRERGYLLCIDQKRLRTEASVGKSGKNSLLARMMKHFERPASSPITDFLLKHDDPRLRVGINDISIQAARERQAVDWTRYKARHLAYRMENGLGDKRPLTRWQDNGTCQMPDYYWHGWAKAQTERVWDTLDVNFLRAITRRSDFMSKCRVIDLSQGLDRELDQRASGISGCLTPRGQHFISTRGGPLLGIEALALQGIPIDRLLLSMESQRDLHDLAGNAMSSPVVGAAILCALILGHKALQPGSVVKDKSKASSDISLPSSVVQKYPMHDMLVELSTPPLEPVETILLNAQRSRRLCLCEGQSGTKRKNILKCSKCNHTACIECGRNPLHSYEPIPTDQLTERLAPVDFESYLKTTLPMRLQISGLNASDFDQFQGRWKSKATSTAWETFKKAIDKNLNEELRFSGLSRQRSWTATYEGTYSVLKLICSPTAVEWCLYALPSRNEPSNSPLRHILASPIARMAPSDSLFNGTWYIGAPISSESKITVSGQGPRVDSLGARVGLTDKEFRDTKIWSHLSINVEGSTLDIDINGEYELLQDCGGPCGSLYKRISSHSRKAIFFFLDPTEFGPDELDSWVFAAEHNRLDFGQTREVIAQIQPDWSAFRLGDNPQSANCWYRKWVKSSSTSLKVYLPSTPATYHILDCDVVPQVFCFDCKSSYAPILNCSVPATSSELTMSPGLWERSDLMESPVLLQRFAWLLQKTISIKQFSKWSTIHLAQIEHGLDCRLCAPPKPRLTWARNEKDRICGYEHPEDAAAYEQSVKNRPVPFLGYVSRKEDSYLDFRICLNILTLLHRAIGNLPNASEEPALAWRLCIDKTGFVRQRLPKLVESNNKQNSESTQPPGFRNHRLRPEQLRSLTWMQEQESDQALPFEEEEVVEAILPVINWRAEGRANVKKLVRGGILGDDVGYGKTAISLGLVDMQFTEDSASVPENADGAIPIKATLIVVPHHLFDQWMREIHKFLGSKYRILQIKTFAALRNLSIGEMEKIDIVLASAAIFRANSYYELIRTFTAAPEIPQGDGRVFDEWLRDAIGGVRYHTSLLCTGGSLDIYNSIQEKIKKLQLDAAASSKYNPSRRLKGQKLQDHLAKGNKIPVEVERDSDDSTTEIRPLVTNSRPKNGRKCTKRKREPDGDEDFVESDSSFEKRPKTQRKRPKAAAIRKQEDAKSADATFHLHDAKYDWKRLRSPFLHMFEFNRLIIDEFTYSKDKGYSGVLTVPARKKWILSGTPPLNDFADVKSFSPFLGIHLGVDEDDIRRTENERLKAIQRDKTEVEQFQPFITRRSAAWHKRRHEMSQGFLNQYMRKNVPEIGEIPFTEHIYEVVLAPAERALYIELFVQVMSQNLRIRRQGRGLYDAAEVSRLNQIIGDSDSPEEALVKRCSLFSLDNLIGRYAEASSEDEYDSEGATSGKGKLGTGNTILDIRFQELKDLGADLQTKLRLGLWLKSKLNDDVRNHFDKTLALIETKTGAGELGDFLVKRMVRKCLDFAKANAREKDGAKFYITAQQKRQNSKDTRPEFPASEKAIVQDLNNCNDSIRRLISETPTLESYRVINGGDFAEDESRVLSNSWEKFGGSKIDELVQLLRTTTRIPKDDQVLLFIQFAELINAVSAALDKAKIHHITVTSSDRAQGKELSNFQNQTEEVKSKVLILALGDVTASGLNLQNANHIIFFHPLIARSQYDYESGMAQAIGRSRRYGQQKHVHIYHFLALNTVEVNIFEQRRRECVVKRDQKFISVSRNDVRPSDVADWSGYPLQGSNATDFDDGVDYK
ncbi:hypothetical protein LOZ12_001185 [Ophidiomyces ophidiicola]|uniref:Uncharacterized protein n=1 Tax=Ophidiomyces ophidiicola TaxID=1387563 RepID=A0ACB8V380_9EURO|nr:hypothetical protein LOZ64_001640 [Ophidiomyces ophidiicola]KAI1954533.1 hypothetical protein LOZ62_000828 [Ophidiomyces ophidiicola]KAI1961779.1 hypothetical protein LOZ59_002217 [Ophidiomyces ophidiicola]KAI1974519.1 hypothetical protein LOZ56_001263 [Ophidiomyces ophidiicola]KAI2008873.1 hypothetical protein LOZ50_001791 [Ophidiomyces ophidiicola]